MTEPFQLTAWQASAELQKKSLSSKELVESIISRVDAVEDKIHAYHTVLRDEAIEKAAAVDEKRAKGEALHPWAGIPVALKDNMCSAGHKTTCSSKMLENFIPPYNATVVRKMMDVGMIPIGKTIMDEFAMGSSTEHSYFGRTNNPWNFECVPGGSSGGSTAAVIADEATVALGSDTGGSIRQPAAFCSVTGMKPTYGRVSRYGLIAFASSLDQIGPITKDARDAAELLTIISGLDPNDSTSINEPVPDYTANLERDVKGLKIGLPKEYSIEGMNPEAKRAVDDAAAFFESQGAELVEISLPHTEYAIATYYMICTAEASSNLARYDGVVFGYRSPGPYENIVEMYCKTRSEGFGTEVKRRIMLGTYVLSAGFYDAYYRRAQRVRNLIKQDFDKAFETVDVVLCPSTPSPPFPAGAKLDDPLEMYLSDVFTAPLNLSGLPGISIPGGFTQDGLPLGIQFIAPVLQEERLVQISHCFQQGTRHHLKRPSL